MKRYLLVLVFAAFCAGSIPAAEKHLVFMLGEKEYKTWETVPAFYDQHLKAQGFTATFIQAPPAGADRDNFPGLEKALGKADLVFVSVRRRAPTSSQLEALQAFLKAGKPLIGIRTSSHAFDTKGKGPKDHAEWKTFDPEVLGGNYNGHYGDGHVSITLDKKQGSHPMLKNVRMKKTNKLYRVSPLKETAVPLLWGTFQKYSPEPLAWTHVYGPKKARVFYTSMGTVEDFSDEGFQHLLVNAVKWALETE